MKRSRKFLIMLFAVLWLMLEVNVLVAQSQYSTMTGTVAGVHRGIRKWLVVKSDKDQSSVDFRIGKKTVYNPNRYPAPGERVKVEYLTQKGVNVAYVVTVIK